MNNAEEFLAKKQLFQLGDLPTETPHPKTVNLSDWAKDDLDRALATMRRVDLEALERIAKLKGELTSLFHAVSDTLDAGKRIYLVGCGATGRLSLSLEYLWRKARPHSDQVISLMAGGDVALVHSLEGFEDFPEYGARHLLELGFKSGDLVIGSTEGGETPYVIGAVETAAEMSSRKPLFLYCNTTRILLEKVERSHRVLTNDKIDSYCLETGPMALTGSTRMQASTVLMLVIGLALEFRRDVDQAFSALNQWIEFLRAAQIVKLKDFIVKEAEAYQRGEYTLYATDEFAITVFTDTTERAPTFNLAPFDNPKHMTDRHSLSYVSIPGAGTADAAWKALLARPPRPLQWPDVHSKATHEYLGSFDFGMGAKTFRETEIKGTHNLFQIDPAKGGIHFRFRGLDEIFPAPGTLALFDHLTLKLWLNMHSTLVFGRLNRFEGNLMTWVYPSNGKLIDRAARYSQILMRKAGMAEIDYDDIIRAQFLAKRDLSPKDSIVHRTIQILQAQKTPASGLDKRGGAFC
jgi:N-acetylmuramic acid 6-phosphate etherase